MATSRKRRLNYTRVSRNKKQKQKHKAKRYNKRMPVYTAGRKPLKIGMVTMFKNESMVMREWIEHYKWQGVDIILLLNNNSDDDWQSIVKDYEGFVVVKDAPKKHAQLVYITEIGVPFLKENGVDVFVMVDFDEYFFGRDGKLLKDYVQETFTKPDRPSSVVCGWAMFGSNGHIQQPKSVREGFTMRWSDTTEPANGSTGKSIIMVSDISGGIINCHHTPKVTGRIDQCPAGLQVNHYAIMSKEYFDKVKARRGNAYTSAHETIRDESYRQRYDKNNVKETLLADQVAALNAGRG
jgi:hypothetical protein